MEVQTQSPSRLGIVIVNYCTPALTERCLDALIPTLKLTDARVVVVDNASPDGSYDRLMSYCSKSPERDRLYVVASPVNGGFSAGNNIGIKALKSDYILLLNSDAIPQDDALSALLNAADRQTGVGLITPRLVTSDGAEQVSRFRNHSPLGEFIDGAQSGPVTRFFPFAETPIHPDDWTTSPDWVSFAAVLLNKTVTEKVGPMDEGFFLYYEDCDYCRRIKNAGHTIGFAETATFIHDPGGSTKLGATEKALARLPSYYYASRSRYYRKYYGWLGPLMANFAWLIGRVVAKFRGIFGRPAPAVCASRAHDMWIGWRSGLARSQSQNN